MSAKTPGAVVMLDFGQLPLLFSNFVRVSHTETSFELDFAQVGPSADASNPAAGELRAVSRVAIPAQFVPALLATLIENKRRYEAVFGSIRAPVPMAADQVAVSEEKN